MARTVNTGWRKVTLGDCAECGYDSDYGCNGSGHILCSCNPEFDESYDTTEAGEPQSHYCFGGGSVGCLYDYGPAFCETLDGAIASLAQVYDLTEAEQATLRDEHILYFDQASGTAIDAPGDAYSSRRLEVGADYCELSLESGTCPEDDDR